METALHLWVAWRVGADSFHVPVPFTSVRAGLQNLDPAIDEAAQPGLPWQTFRRVTLPSLRPSIAAGSLLVALYVLSDFGACRSFLQQLHTRHLLAVPEQL